jgi:soluble lytic murein transglycosylase-like protein
MLRWILVLIHAVTVAGSPYEPTFEATARAIDKVSHESPIYEGNDGPERTAAELVALASYESSFNPRAVHADQGGDSLGLYQINTSNLRELGLAREDLFDPETATRAAVKLLRASHRTCRGWPPMQQLAAYATGRGLCDVPEGVTASRHRLERAVHLRREHPVFWTVDKAAIER